MREIENYNKTKGQVLCNLRRNPKKTQKEWNQMVENLMSNIDEELTRVLGEPWNFLKRQNEGYVARHTIIVVALTFEDPTMHQ